MPQTGWSRFLLLAIGVFGVGCQDQQALPLGSTDATDPRSLTARIFLSDPCRDIANKSALARDLVAAVNTERSRAKLPPLRVDETLSQVADFYACRLIDAGFFDHVDPWDGSTVDKRAADFGYPFLKIGENLAAGQRSVEQTMADWMNSPLHKKNILDPAYTEIGVAIKEGGKDGPYWVQEFGRPITAGEEVKSTAPEGASRPAAADTTSAPANP